LEASGEGVPEETGEGAGDGSGDGAGAGSAALGAGVVAGKTGGLVTWEGVVRGIAPQPESRMTAAHTTKNNALKGRNTNLIGSPQSDLSLKRS